MAAITKVTHWMKSYGASETDAHFLTKFFVEEKDPLLKYLMKKEKLTAYQALREILREQVELIESMAGGSVSLDSKSQHAALAAIEHIENGREAAESYIASLDT